MADDPMPYKPDYFGDDIYAAYGRAMAQAQQFEDALGVFVFGRRAFADETFLTDPEGWTRDLHRERGNELGVYAMKLMRMTAGQRAKELDLPARLTDDVSAIVGRRNHLAHQWFREYSDRHGHEGECEAAVIELRELETALRRRAVAFVVLLGKFIQCRQDGRELDGADAEQLWASLVPSFGDDERSELERD